MENRDCNQGQQQKVLPGKQPEEILSGSQTVVGQRAGIFGDTGCDNQMLRRHFGRIDRSTISDEKIDQPKPVGKTQKGSTVNRAHIRQPQPPPLAQHADEKRKSE